MKRLFAALLIALAFGAQAQTLVKPLNGGTGIANANTKTITLGGPLVTTGAYTTTFAATGTATHTLPATSATLARTDAAQTFAGVQTFSGNIAAPAGTVSAPGIYLGTDTGTGLYRIGANNYGVAVSGAKVLDIASNGLAVTGTLSSTGVLSTTDATDSVSSTTGAIKSAGGIAAVKNIFVGASGNYYIEPSGTASRYFFVYSDNTYAGSFNLQAGGGSGAYGGSVSMYGHAHATKPGWVTAGISSGSGGKFSVNASALGLGTDVFTVDTSGNTAALGIISTTDATDATSATAASLKTAGGIAAVKGLWIGQTSRLVGIATFDAAPVLSATSSPASGAACTAGTITWDASYIYVCTASAAWKRAALTGGY